MAVGLGALLLFAGACRRGPCPVDGVWEGQAGDSVLVLSFRPDGQASISVTADNQMSTTYCQWALVDKRIQLTSTRREVRWFTILRCSPEEMTLRLASGPAGVCQLKRVEG